MDCYENAQKAINGLNNTFFEPGQDGEGSRICVYMSKRNEISFKHDNPLGIDYELE